MNENIIKFRTKKQDRIKDILKKIEKEKGEKTFLSDDIISEISSPIIELVNEIIIEAYRYKISDIHIEPLLDIIRIRYRLDGSLINMYKLDKSNLEKISTRIKIISGMDIAESRLPQEGRMDFKIDNNLIDLRLSIMPTIDGEKIVIRILDKENFYYSKDTLGFSEGNLNKINKLLYKSTGMILITGPTGSGKTTTLYSLLKELNTMDKNIITIEDPVEYKITGISQIQVNEKAGLDYPIGLKAILRQDPDIIMIGEVRDNETARIAITSAMTGHLVLATMHTYDSASSIIRLMDMGIESYLVSTSVIGVISQRLIKRLCKRCSKSYMAKNWEKKLLDRDINSKLLLNKIGNCNYCNNGYSGRIAIHEIIIIDKYIRELIDRNTNWQDIKNKAFDKNNKTMYDQAIELVIDGVIGIEELIELKRNL